MKHERTILDKYYRALMRGSKTFEIRQERETRFKVGDKLQLTNEKTGEKLIAKITYVYRGDYGLLSGYVAMGLKVL